MNEKKSNVPKLRFPEFADAWEQRRLNEIADIVTGSTPPTIRKDYYDGSYLFASPVDIQDNRYIESTITTLSKEGFYFGRQIRSGASLFVSIGSTIGKVAQAFQPLVTNQQINSVVSTNEMDDDFIFTLLESKALSIKLLAATQAVPIVNKTTFGETIIWVPKHAEQKQIGSFFHTLDNLITLHQRELIAFLISKFNLTQTMTS